MNGRRKVECICCLVVVGAVAWSGCGVIGPPVAPEDVGVAPTIERQKRREADAVGRSSQKPALSPAETTGAAFGEGVTTEPAEELPVPPTQSVGTR